MSKGQVACKINWPLLTVGGLMALTCLGLSYWQLGRAEDKRQWVEQAEARRSKPLGLQELLLSGEALDYRSVRVRGHFLSGQDLLLDNRVRQGRAGYERLTPFSVEGVAELVLVNRGWLPQGEDRQQLPVLAPLDGELLISGYLYRLGGGLVLKQTPPEVGWPKRIQRLDKAELESLFKRPLLGYEVRLDRPVDQGHETGWATVTVTPERHRAYALQWLLLALAIATLTYRAAKGRRIAYGSPKLPAQ